MSSMPSGIGASMAGPGNQQPDHASGYVPDPELTDDENALRQEQYWYDNDPFYVDPNRNLSSSDQDRLNNPPAVQNPSTFDALVGIAAADPAYSTINAGDPTDGGSVGPNGGNSTNQMVPRTTPQNLALVAKNPINAAKNLFAFDWAALPPSVQTAMKIALIALVGILGVIGVVVVMQVLSIIKDIER